MVYLQDVDLADLHDALERVEGKKSVLRIAVGIGYANGVSPSTLAEWYDVSRTTIYNWLERLDRLDEEEPEAVLGDAGRPGRPRKLSPDRRGELQRTLAAPPNEAGYDTDAWTPALVQRHLGSAHGVEYTRRHVRDLLHEFGLEPADGGWTRRA